MTDEVFQVKVIICNQLGMHARAATRFVQMASKYPCDVVVVKDSQRVNGKSIMGVLMLVASMGTAIIIETKGPSAEEAGRALAELVQNRFGEER